MNFSRSIGRKMTRAFLRGPDNVKLRRFVSPHDGKSYIGMRKARPMFGSHRERTFTRGRRSYCLLSQGTIIRF